MELVRLKGITEKRAKELQKLGIADSAQLIRYFPRAYLDMTDRTSVLSVYHNDMALLSARLVSVDPTNPYSAARRCAPASNRTGSRFRRSGSICPISPSG